MTFWMIRFPALLLPVVAWLPVPLIHAQEAGETQIEQGLVADYPFTGDANDASGNGHDGIVFGPQLTADRFGNPQSAYRFDDDDWMVLPPEVMDGLFDVTASFWLKTSKRTTQTIISAANNVRDKDYLIFFMADHLLRFHSHGDIVPRPSQVCEIYLAPISLPEEPVMPPVFVLIPVWALASIGKI